MSTNSGSTWFEATNASYFGSTSVASSADGANLIAVDSLDDFIDTSDDSGTTWTQTTAPSGNTVDWFSVASSADGTQLAAASYNNSWIYVSTNSGETWTQSGAPMGYWRWVASSADGSKLAAVNWDSNPSHPSSIYVSTNAGITWTQTPTFTNAFRVACSADGNRLVAISFPGFVHTSTNGGASWTQTSAPSNGWYCVASSADGNKLAAGAVPGGIYTSTDAGKTWKSKSAPVAHWYAMASSADGNKLVAVDDSGGIWTTQMVPPPQLNLIVTNGNVNVSWLVPSKDFVLQQSLDLKNWTDVTNVPTLNFTNLQEQVDVSGSDKSCFYRLATP